MKAFFSYILFAKEVVGARGLPDGGMKTRKPFGKRMNDFCRG